MKILIQGAPTHRFGKGLFMLVRTGYFLMVTLVVCILALVHSNPGTTQEPAESIPKNLQVDQLVAWCIVPFDANKRSPRERSEMLQELGLKHLAYDWREEHVVSWDDELDQLEKHGIELTAFWCSSSLSPTQDPGTQRIVEFLKRRKVHTQLWIMLPDQELAKVSDEAQRIAKAATAVRQLAEQVDALGCQVGIYNHGGWVGKPATLVEIMKSLRDLKNVGIVYNFHHAHEDLESFPEALMSMLPHLMCLNLNGTTVGGPKIQPIGDGNMDRQILGWIRQAGYSGPVGILDHREELDAKMSLQLNLKGLARLLDAKQE